MDWLKRAPGSTRSPSGLEWKIWKKLPYFLFGGMAMSALVLVRVLEQDPETTGMAIDPETLRTQFMVWGALLVYWTLFLTVAIGCVVVMLMKGPQYVADSYPIPHKDRPD